MKRMLLMPAHGDAPAEITLAIPLEDETWAHLRIARELAGGDGAGLPRLEVSYRAGGVRRSTLTAP